MDDAALENSAWLQTEYERWLFESAPESVLDVGCGAGRLLRVCRDREVAATGLDAEGPRLHALRADGLEVHAGSAYELPFADGAFDWVSMRHVPHHLADPAVAFAEALRVARTGFLVAEPWFDVTLASQRAALALDVWEKRQHRRRGTFHDEVHDLDALLSLVPDGVRTDLGVEVQRHLWLHARAAGRFAGEARELVAELPEDHAERRTLAELLERLDRDGLTWNGSLCVKLLHG